MSPKGPDAGASSTGPTLVVLAAGASTRFGRPKQLERLGPDGETLFDYAFAQAARAGFADGVLVIQGEMATDFEDHFRHRQGALPVTLCEQRQADLPPGVDPAAAPEGPLGTAHAVWAARQAVSGPFAVVNADDHYGADAYRLAAAFLDVTDPDGTGFGLVGYRLDRTLHPGRGVSRAVCRIAAANRVVAISELHDVTTEAGQIHGYDAQGSAVSLTGRETVSMNFWAFTPRVFEALEAALSEFLNRPRSGETELHLPYAVDAMIHSGFARVEALQNDDGAFGVTFEADAERVASLLPPISFG